MRIAETDYHLKIKEKVKTKLEEWYPGITIKEYPSHGQEADTYHISYSGLSTLIEVIWTDTWNQFLRDMDILQNSVDFIKIAIVNPEIFKTKEEEKKRYFDKMRISEIKKGYIVSEMFNGQKLLAEEKYFLNVKEFIDFASTLIIRNEKNIQIHREDIKNFVINPLLNKLNPTGIGHFEVDEILLKDMLENHYPAINALYKRYYNLPLKIKNLNAQIIDTIRESLVNGSQENQLEIIEDELPHEYKSNEITYSHYKEKIFINKIVNKIKNSLDTNEMNIDSLELIDSDIVDGEFIIRFKNKSDTIDFSDIVYTSRDKEKRLKAFKILNQLIFMNPTLEIKKIYDNMHKKESEFNKVKNQLRGELRKLRFNVRLNFSRGICDFL